MGGGFYPPYRWSCRPDLHPLRPAIALAAEDEARQARNHLVSVRRCATHLRLAGMSGFAVLRWIWRQPRLAGLPVVVITGMPAPGDARRAQDLGATGFLTKPFSLAKLVEMARQIRDNWLRPAHGLEKRLDLSASERGLQLAKLQGVTGRPKSVITAGKSRASAAGRLRSDTRAVQAKCNREGGPLRANAWQKARSEPC